MVVCTAGTRFRYPSSFVLVPGDMDVELTRIHASLFQHQVVADADATSSARTTNAVDNALSKLASAVRVDCSFFDKRAAQRTVDKVWQDGMVSSGLFIHGYGVSMFLCQLYCFDALACVSLQHNRTRSQAVARIAVGTASPHLCSHVMSSVT